MTHKCYDLLSKETEINQLWCGEKQKEKEPIVRFLQEREKEEQPGNDRIKKENSVNTR